MALKVYNTLTRELEAFTPLEEGRVRAYVCGLTVYDDMHIGHARTYLAFDVIFRYLKYRGYELSHVQNITDVDDKIIRRAGERGVDPLELASMYADRAAEDRRELGLLEADDYPRVSENIEEIIGAVETLVGKGCAYEVGGDVYFSVESHPEYGRLSNQDVEQLVEHRIEHDPGKRSPVDFALWKSVGEDEPGFESPWGRGRPGWHIECSAMSRKCLGDRIDIHGGALDLIFPHHENEIAQSESLTGGKPFVRYWLHTGFLQSSGEKMSKSLGNILPVREFLKFHSRDALRLFILQTHYRSPVDYSEDNIASAEQAVARLRNYRKKLGENLDDAGEDGGNSAGKMSEELRENFISHMDNDFNTPQAMAAVFETLRDINTLLEGGGQSRKSIENSIRIFDELMSVTGLDVEYDTVTLKDDERYLMEERNRHRREKNYVEADRIRDLLLERGIRVVDRKDGTTVAERT
ncbi:MAG: cysteine--tRNA ligase [Candidatus Altiarchaeales archaeon]|nr:cysteine--tRNA ligase [Candidatus Altiarchaeales archaeon]MBD3417336.1 cysteine--tRNA ligase [Candidatus Altiarchaeales archaeon]